VYREIVLNIKETLEDMNYTCIIGEFEWSSKIKFPLMQILPGTGSREPYGVGGPNKEDFQVSVIIARRGVSLKSEELELDNLEDMMTIVGAFKNKTTTIGNRQVRFSVNSFDATRMFVEGAGFYLVGAAVVLSAKFIQ